jgi:hypothetical protein
VMLFLSVCPARCFGAFLHVNCAFIHFYLRLIPSVWLCAVGYLWLYVLLCGYMYFFVVICASFVRCTDTSIIVFISDVPSIIFRGGGGSTNPAEDRGQMQWGSGGPSPLVSAST